MEVMAAFFVGMAIGCVACFAILGQVLHGLGRAAELIDDNAEAAYMCGLEEGYGYANQPWNPVYQNAGEWLKAHRADTFPELADEDLP